MLDTLVVDGTGGCGSFGSIGKRRLVVGFGRPSGFAIGVDIPWASRAGRVFCLSFWSLVVGYGVKEKEAAPASGKLHLESLCGIGRSMVNEWKMYARTGGCP